MRYLFLLVFFASCSWSNGQLFDGQIHHRLHTIITLDASKAEQLSDKPCGAAVIPYTIFWRHTGDVMETRKNHNVPVESLYFYSTVAGVEDQMKGWMASGEQWYMYIGIYMPHQRDYIYIDYMDYTKDCEDNLRVPATFRYVRPR